MSELVTRLDKKTQSTEINQGSPKDSPLNLRQGT